MFTPEQYRAKAAEYAKLGKTANRPDEVREFRKLEQSFTELADNAQWVTENRNKIVQSTAHTTATLVPDPAAQSISQQ